MGNYRLEITLLSDLCVSDGSNYASMLDVDICYDSYGFPYIPARRIKGCLKECALELKDWGKDISIEEIFGKEGSQGAKVRIGNAYIQGYKSMKEQAEKNKDHILFHPQNVLNQFSYVRTQVSLNSETGVPEPGSFQSMRVINKGLVFEADIIIDECYKADFEVCCHVLTGIGLARTRGLGEVSVKLVEMAKAESLSHATLEQDADYLEYVLYLDEPVICKDSINNDIDTMDYIEGSKILGNLISSLKKTEIGDLVCSNAYIGKNGLRYTEVPACYYSIKNNKHTFVNKLVDDSEETSIQTNRMKHSYVAMVDGKLEIIEVAIEERYHHRRPKNKSFGRVHKSDDKESALYKMSSISSGQEFYGYIKGTTEQIKEIYDYIIDQGTFYIGKSKNSEYGKSRISVINTKNTREMKQLYCNEFIVKLEAPTIVYSDKAFYSVRVEDLVKEVNTVLGLGADVKPYKTYLNYVTLGGYNVTWQERKPEIEAFDKGSVLHYKLNTPMTVIIDEGCHIGERIHEGYGEICVSVVDRMAEKRYLEYADFHKEKSECGLYVVERGTLADAICKKLFLSYLELNAMESVTEFMEGKNLVNYRSTVNNMIVMTKEQSTFAEINYVIAKRYKGATEKKVEKRRYAETIMKYVTQSMDEVINKFSVRYHVSWATDKENEERKIAYLRAFLTAIKYKIRQLEITKEKGDK